MYVEFIYSNNSEKDAFKKAMKTLKGSGSEDRFYFLGYIKRTLKLL